MKNGAVKIAAAYFIISLLWIVLSDKALFLLQQTTHSALIYYISTFKGLLFVLATALGLYILIRKNERHILANEIRYRDIYENNPNPMWMYDPETLKFTSVNKAALDKYGYTQQEFMAMSVLDIRPPEDRAEILEAIKQHNQQNSNKGTWQHITKSGETLYVNITLNAVDYQGRKNYMVFVQDITETTQQQVKLQEAINRYEMAERATLDVFYDFDIRQNKLIYNKNISNLVQMPDSAINSTLEWWRQLIHPEDIGEVQQSQLEVIESRKFTWNCEYRIHTGDGRYKYVYDQAYLMFNSDGEPIRMIGAIKDIDAIKLSEQENKRLDNIITKVNNMVMVTDNNWRVTWVNHAFEQFTGYTKQEIVGSNPTELLDESIAEPDLLLTMRKSLSELQPFSAELPSLTKNGKPYWVFTEFTPLFNDGGVQYGYILVQSDISLRKEKEKKIAQQISTLRNIAWMSSHQLRKPVATILGLVNLIEMPHSPEELEELVELLKTTTLELDMIVHEINFEAFHSIGE